MVMDPEGVHQPDNGCVEALVGPVRAGSENWVVAPFHGLKPVATHGEPLRGAGWSVSQIGSPTVSLFARCRQKMCDMLKAATGGGLYSLGMPFLRALPGL
ncbi:MAG: hypothetical protein V1792_15690 [Pseudomonadota bacterium]